MIDRPETSTVPDTPGVYLFRDVNGGVLYVGKAKSLRKRVPQYWSADLPLRTRAMVESAVSVDWIVTESEVAALMLEHTLVKEHRSRFNVRLRDDKSFPYLAITRDQEWPRALVMRGRRRKGVEYFGPYAHAYAIRQTLDLLLRTFPVRTCTDSKFRTHQGIGRPCLLFHIERCSGPCVGEVTPERYQGYVDGLAAFLDGDRDDSVSRLRTEMSRSPPRAGSTRSPPGCATRRPRWRRRWPARSWFPTARRPSTWWRWRRTTSRRSWWCSG